MIDQETGQGLQEEAEDGHAGTEALCVRQCLLPGVEDADMDDVCEDREQQASQELQGGDKGIALSSRSPH